MMTYLSSQKFSLFFRFIMPQCYYANMEQLCSFPKLSFLDNSTDILKKEREMERMKIFVLINIILMNGIDSKLHFHIFHSFRPISTMALCQITYVFIFPFSSIFFTIQIHFDIFFLLHYSHLGPFFLHSLIPPSQSNLHTILILVHTYMCSIYPMIYSNYQKIKSIKIVKGSIF